MAASQFVAVADRWLGHAVDRSANRYIGTLV